MTPASLSPYIPFRIFDVYMDTCISHGQEGLLDDYLVQDVFEVDPHVLEVGDWVVELLVYDF